ncbi:MAG TPA: hypothetical protein VMB24_04025 [Dehalococcoidales bacterium]|nr:hypothetical protein [Dehalococcoidales bacterium]
MYKVRCKLVKFEGDEKTFPCHFNYRIGDEFYYDGERFTGRICPALLAPMMPIVYGVHLLGQKFCENVPYRYRGTDTRDAAMAKYDGVGWRHVDREENLQGKADGVFKKSSATQKAKGAHFTCGDTRTLAHFSCDPVDLSDSDYCQPFYRRAISILEKIEAEPGIKQPDILKKFSDFEREVVSPPLTPVLLQVLIEALVDTGYIELRGEKAHPTGKQPPSRPKIARHR